MNRIYVATSAFLIALAAGSAHAAMISAADTGYAPSGYAYESLAELRNLKNNGDFEVGFLNSGASAYTSQAQSNWIQGVNDLVIAYNIVTNAVSVSLNGVTASSTLANDPGSITLHLVAKNAGSHSASLTIQNLAFNGSAVDLSGLGAYLFASSKAGSGALADTVHARIDDAAFGAGSWTLMGQIVADWTGPAPSGQKSHLDISFAPGPERVVPASGTIALASLALSGAGIHRLRRTQLTRAD